MRVSVIVSLSLVLLLASAMPRELSAFENILTDPVDTYPPSCVVSYPMLSDDDYFAVNVPVLGGSVDLTDPNGGTRAVSITVSRIFCADAGRSVVTMRIEADGPYIMPTLTGTGGGGVEVVLRIASEPNSWAADLTGRVIDSVTPTYYFLENPNFVEALGFQGASVPSLSPGEYSGSLAILIIDEPTGAAVGNTMPAVTTSEGEFPLFLQGRVSGNWVVEGAADQGFVIAVSELPDARTFIFVSMYTYDNDGNAIWLVANDFFIADTDITLDYFQLSGGRFLGAGTADRQVVGQATLRAISCGRLEFEYDFGGLGSGTVDLVRLFDAEIMGYGCSSFEDRVSGGSAAVSRADGAIPQTAAWKPAVARSTRQSAASGLR